MRLFLSEIGSGAMVSGPFVIVHSQEKHVRFQLILPTGGDGPPLRIDEWTLFASSGPRKPETSIIAPH